MILKKPIITEKMTGLMDQPVPQYGFEVDINATKDQIRNIIEQVYDVEVDKVRTVIMRGKPKTRMTKSGIIHGKAPNYKKAYVTLKEGSTIDFYKHI